MANFLTAKQLLASDQPQEALELLADATDAEGLFLKGKALWRLGRRAEATSAYAQAAALDPESPAAQALDHARDIESFFNPDLLNP